MFVPQSNFLLHGNPMATLKTNTLRIFSSVVFAMFAINANAQNTISPPSIGQKTKGEPAVEETSVANKSTLDSRDRETEAKPNPSIFGNASITESRRESGQVYLIELEHSSGSKQYIEETGSDTKIESTSNDIEETPNLPKWKIGSW